MLCLSQISKAIGGLITILKQRLKQNKTVEAPEVSGLKKNTEFCFCKQCDGLKFLGCKESAGGDLRVNKLQMRQFSQPKSPPNTTKGWWNLIFFQHAMLWNTVLRHGHLIIGLCPLGGKIWTKPFTKTRRWVFEVIVKDSMSTALCQIVLLQPHRRALQCELLSPCFAKASQHHLTRNFDEASLKCYLFGNPLQVDLCALNHCHCPHQTFQTSRSKTDRQTFPLPVTERTHCSTNYGHWFRSWSRLTVGVMVPSLTLSSPSSWYFGTMPQTRVNSIKDLAELTKVAEGWI